MRRNQPVPTPNDRAAALQQICMSRNWVDRLAQRWHIAPSTVRLWARAGHLGPVHRNTIGLIGVGSHAVLQFEEKWAVALGVGDPALDIWQLYKRYGIKRRTFTYWRRRYSFPRPVRVPGTIIRRWRVRDIEQWEYCWRIVPKTTLAA